MRAAAWSALGLYVALTVTSVALVVLQGAGSGALGALAFAGFAGVGTMIALREPGNAVGWVLLATAIAFAGVEAGEAYVDGTSNPAREWAAWTTAWAGNLWFSLAIVILPLLFPYGRLPSRRWRPVLWLGIAEPMIGAVAVALKPGPLELQSTSGIENPVGVSSELPARLVDVDIVLGGIAVVLTGAAVVVRFRRSRGVERQQLKWFALIGVLAAACLSVAVVSGQLFAADAIRPVAVTGWLTGLALLGIGLPAATGIAIFRHRLYDVDVVIRRTLVYGVLTAALGATYLALVLLAGLAVGRSNVAIAVSTLAVAALFRPARARIQAGVDRRFYRRRYDSQRTLEAFSARLRDQVDLDAVSQELRGVVADTVQPAEVSLWLRPAR
jgi:hypothetical protein